MQKLYKIEIFDNAFKLVGHSAILEPEIVYDYISMSTTSIACLDEMPNIRQYQLAHITDNDGNIVFQGVVYGFTQEKNAMMQVSLKPLLSLMDRDFPTTGYITTYSTVEGWIEYFLKTVYQGNENVPASYTAMKIQTTTQTKINPDTSAATGTTMNMYDFSVSALQLYGVIVKARFDPQSKILSFEIGADREPSVTIEADLENVISKTFNMDADGEKFNLVQLIYQDSDGAQTVRWFALNADGSIVESTPPNFNLSGIVPPLMMTSQGVGTGTTPTESEWMEKAREILKPSADSQQISLSVSETDRVVRINIDDIGRSANILHDGVSYMAVLTAINATRGVKNLTFGFARTDLTTLLKLQRRGVTW